MAGKMRLVTENSRCARLLPSDRKQQDKLNMVLKILPNPLLT